MRWIGIVAAAVATALFVHPANAEGGFSRASSADPAVLNLVRLLESARFDRVEFDTAELSEDGRSIRLVGMKARVLEGYVMSAPTVTATGVLRAGSRISAETMVFAEPTFRGFDGSGTSVAASQMSIADPETIVTPGKIGRMRFARVTLANGKVAEKGEVVVSLKEASFEASNWMAGGEVAQKMVGRLTGSFAPKVFSGLLPFDLGLIAPGALPLDVIATTEFGDAGTMTSSLVVNTKTVGNYEFRLDLNGVRPEAFTVVRELEEASRSDGGSSKPIGESPRFVKAVEGVSVGLVSLQATGMEWVGSALDKAAKSKRKSRSKVESEVIETIDSWIGSVASEQTAESSKREISRFLSSPHAITVQLSPRNASPTGGNWFLNLLGLPLDAFGFSVKAN